jgi:hypothetical protein
VLNVQEYRVQYLKESKASCGSPYKHKTFYINLFTCRKVGDNFFLKQHIFLSYVFNVNDDLQPLKVKHHNHPHLCPPKTISIPHLLEYKRRIQWGMLQ